MRKYDARIDKITLIGLEQLKQLKTCTQSTAITINNNLAFETPKSLKVLYSVKKGSKCFYDILPWNREGHKCCSKWENKLNK